MSVLPAVAAAVREVRVHFILALTRSPVVLACLPACLRRLSPTRNSLRLSAADPAVLLERLSSKRRQKTKHRVVGPIQWGHSGPRLSRVVVVVVVVDIDAQAACDSGGVRQ